MKTLWPQHKWPVPGAAEGGSSGCFYRVIGNACPWRRSPRGLKGCFISFGVRRRCGCHAIMTTDTNPKKEQWVNIEKLTFKLPGMARDRMSATIWPPCLLFTVCTWKRFPGRALEPSSIPNVISVDGTLRPMIWCFLPAPVKNGFPKKMKAC